MCVGKPAGVNEGSVTEVALERVDGGVLVDIFFFGVCSGDLGLIGLADSWTGDRVDDSWNSELVLMGAGSIDSRETGGGESFAIGGGGGGERAGGGGIEILERKSWLTRVSARIAA